ncbi:hypothetical protein DYB35_006932 [Aphanomyces astaci]|uniref:Uncharacterized protein n=1 Tax=Aphanomyces astaci TaxID=112090 RepID=A0A418CUM9_APHAT|nr:hypothetical protein DYB35_006932 [Aphanomyces astaci]
MAATPSLPSRPLIDIVVKVRRPWWHHIINVAGVVYMLGTVSLSVFVWTIFGTYMANDIFLPHFRDAGMQSALIDLFNTALVTANTSWFDITDPAFAIQKSYEGTSTAPQPVFPTYPRSLLFSGKQSLEASVLSLRDLQLDDLGYFTCMYCWMDFKRQWELAHSEQRQQRCLLQKKRNAAMYFESLMRNTDFVGMELLSQGAFDIAYFNEISKTAIGAAWVYYIRAHAWVSVAEEVRVWTQYNLNQFTMQWANQVQSGVEESVSITNAVGFVSYLRIKSMPKRALSVLSSSGTLTSTPTNDYTAMLESHSSLVRSSVVFFALHNTSNNNVHANLIDTYLGPPVNAVTRAIRAQWGPFGNFDLEYVAPPGSLTVFVQHFGAAFIAFIRNVPLIDTKPASRTTTSLHPTPRKWTNTSLVFYGGDPLCLNGQPQPFIQESFGFDSACTHQNPFSIDWSVPKSLFAMAILGQQTVSSMCTLVPQDEKASCGDMLGTALGANAAFQAFVHTDEIPTVIRDIVALEVSTVQFVGRAGHDITIESQALHDRSDKAWSVFGWMSLFEWARGEREVVTFQNDFRDLTLMSHVYRSLYIHSNPNDVGYKLGVTLLVASAIVPGALCIVMVLVLWVWLRRQRRFVGRNWFVFNRVAGTVWIGRPLLVIRGVVAMMCLATAPVQLVGDGTTSHFELVPRTVLQSLVLAGEATWITYVLYDLIYPVAARASVQRYAPLSSILAWGITFGLDYWVPPTVTATIDRQCVFSSIGTQIACSAGSVQVGSKSQMMLIWTIQISTVVVCAVLGQLSRANVKDAASSSPTLILPGAAMTFMHQNTQVLGCWCLDDSSAVMSGMVYFHLNHRAYVADVTLWLVLDCSMYDIRRLDHAILFPHSFERSLASSICKSDNRAGVDDAPARYARVPFTSRLSFVRKPNRLTAKHPGRRYTDDGASPRDSSSSALLIHRFGPDVAIAIGFGMIMLSLVTNVIYMLVTAPQSMANDYYWASFNSTGTHAFLIQLFNRQLLDVNANKVVRVDTPGYADLTQLYNESTSVLLSGGVTPKQHLYGFHSTLDQVIVDLRAMDPCMMPWMFTQYCWVDFTKRWEMASTAARQRRCDASNGAMFLEGVLRNLRSWDSWRSCWGDSFEIALARPLRQHVAGRQWLEDVQGGWRPVPDEVAAWASHAITRFTLQWQDFKSLGFSNSFQVENTLGAQYELSMSNNAGAWRQHLQSTFKMYWGFASDLWAVASNDTSVCGLSLIRGATDFAFSNISREELLVANTTIPNVLPSGLQNLRDLLGPFGNVDMTFESPPAVLTQFYHALMSNLSNLTFTDVQAQRSFLALPAKIYYSPFPPQIAMYNAVVTLQGGNLLCGNDMPDLAGAIDRQSSMYSAFSTDNTCSLGNMQNGRPDAFQTLFAVVGTSFNHNMTDEYIAQTCVWDAWPMANCADVYASVLAFATSHNATFGPLRALAQATHVQITSMNIMFVQFIVNHTEPSLFQVNILDPTNAVWQFTGWRFLYDWATGSREVVTFQGDAGAISTMSDQYAQHSMSPNASEIPRDVSFVLLVVCQYVTVLFVTMGGLIALYTVTTRGHIKGGNLLKMSRIVGLVWAGRVFLFIRSVTAMICLHTARLDLVQHGHATSFVSPPLAWTDLMLAALELHWFVYILNDTFTFVTQHYTKYYASHSAWLAWLVTVIWSQLEPNQHAVRVRRTCTAVDMDFELVCSSGVVEIGSISRVGVSIAICFGSVVVCYVWQLRTRRESSILDIPSLMLPSQAKYLLDFHEWCFHDTYFIDQPSALMAGVISIEWRRRMYLFDIKKWRFFSVSALVVHPSAPPRFKYAIPILE